MSDVLLTQRFTPEIGGGVEWLYQIFRRSPSPIQVVTNRYDASSAEEIFQALQIHRSPILLQDWGLDRLDSLVRYWRMYRGLARIKSPRRIYTAHIVPEVLSTLPLRLTRRKFQLISFVHGEEITACETSRQLRLLLRWLSRYLDLVITSSQYSAKLIEQYVPAARIKTVYPGVDLKAFRGSQEKGAALRQQLGIKPEERLLLTLGRITPRKNQTGVVRAVARLKERFPQIRYLVAGGGEGEQELLQLVSDLKVKDRVTLLGEVDDETKRALFGACEIFIMPSIKHLSDIEGFGIVFIEAGAARKAVIGGQIGGQREAVVDGETGIIVDGESDDAIGGAIEKLLLDQSLRERLGESGFERAKNFDWDEVAKRVFQVVANHCG